MLKQRFIFDLDGTLLTCDYGTTEVEYFKHVFGDQAYEFFPKIGEYLDEYERTFPRYDKGVLSEFLSIKSNLPFTEKIIDGWINLIPKMNDTLEDGVGNTLEYLKSRGASIVVLTNWFGNTQIARLKNARIYDYFDEVYTGEYQLKPHRCAYMVAKGDFDPRECVEIGDNVDKDYVGPRANGIESVLYDKDNIHHNNIVKVKKITDIIGRY